MTECGQCGACCEVIPLSETKRRYRDRHRLGGSMNYNRTDVPFVLKHFHRISRAEAVRRNPAMTRANQRYFYDCDAYDWETKSCTAHEDRPMICRGFPWYQDSVFGHTDGKLDEYAIVPFPKCSYWADIPRERWPENVIPLESVP